MTIKKITAIIDEFQLEAVEKALDSHGVCGFTAQSIQGRGDYCHNCSRNHLVNQVKIELYTEERLVQQITRLILHTADLGEESEGLVAITSVDELFWVNGERHAAEDEFNYFEVEHE